MTDVTTAATQDAAEPPAADEQLPRELTARARAGNSRNGQRAKRVPTEVGLEACRELGATVAAEPAE